MIGAIKRLGARLYHRVKSGVRSRAGAILPRNSHFEGGNTIFEGTEISECMVGRGTYVGRFSRVRQTKIGRFCSIAEGVSIGFGLHPTRQFVSTYPAFYNGTHQATPDFRWLLQKKYSFQEHQYADPVGKWCCVIGHDVWLCDGVRVFDGVEIGSGAIVAAGSIVTSDCQPYGIYAGAPARLLRFRFTESQIKFLVRLQWWDRSDEWLSKHSHLFGNIEDLERALS